jgi:Right handed beta helix region
MFLDNPRLAICAGVFCFAAASAGFASAIQVYPGCAVPPTEFDHVWYIDPVNGKTQAEGGLGTRAAPWNSLQAAFSVQPGYKGPLLTTAPYRHLPAGGAGYVFEPGPHSGPIEPGDEILLMSGNYGDVSTSDWNVGLRNPTFVTIAAAPGQTPVFSFLAVVASTYLVFSGITVEGTADSSPSHARFPLVQVGPWRDKTGSNLVFTSMRISSADDTSGWTQADWRKRRRNGGIFTGGGADTPCVSVTESHISNVEFGVTVSADKMLVSGNEIDHFGDDGIDYFASNILITKNYIHDNLDLADGAHPDGMQGYPGKFSNVVIDSNRVIRQTDPNPPFPNFLQGIDAFDGDWTDLTVTNNVVVTSSCWGIGFGSVHHGRIINNTVLFDEWSRRMPGNCKPLITVGNKTHDGEPSNDVIVRNNISNGLSIYSLDPDMVMDHNICAAIDGVCPILTILPDGTIDRGAFKPGMHGDHNFVDRRRAEAQFIHFDPAKFAFDLRLKPGASAIGAGNPAQAPATDITGAARGNPVDAGAYRYKPSE